MAVGAVMREPLSPLLSGKIQGSTRCSALCAASPNGRKLPMAAGVDVSISGKRFGQAGNGIIRRRNFVAA
jgi:hypothetical protein